MSKETFMEAIAQAKAKFFENEEFKAKVADALKIESFDDFMKEFKLIWEITIEVVNVVEQVYNEYHTITEEERIDVAAELLDNLIEFKGWASPLELLDGSLFKVLISAAVQALNDKYGSGHWFSS